jgi:hypothetical protein
MTASFYLSGNAVHDRVITALYEGCPDEKTLVKGFKYTPADVGVVFGVYKSKVPISWPRGEVYRAHRGDGSDVVVLETGYIKRGDSPSHYYAAGLNGLNGRADFKNKNSPSGRFLELGVEVKPWREAGKHVVLCGQVPWDASVDHLDYPKWLEETQRKLSTSCGRKIVYKEHPCIEVGPPLETFLKDAWACVTLNSNSAVEAAIAGVPVIAMDEGSMAWGIASHHLELDNPKTPDRTQWLNDLAYSQWTPGEMQTGRVWRHLFG